MHIALLNVCGGGTFKLLANNLHVYVSILLLIALGSSKGSDEQAHQHRAFAAPMHKIWILKVGSN